MYWLLASWCTQSQVHNFSNPIHALMFECYKRANWFSPKKKKNVQIGHDAQMKNTCNILTKSYTKKRKEKKKVGFANEIE